MSVLLSVCVCVGYFSLSLCVFSFFVHYLFQLVIFNVTYGFSFIIINYIIRITVCVWGVSGCISDCVWMCISVGVCKCVSNGMSVYIFVEFLCHFNAFIVRHVNVSVHGYVCVHFMCLFVYSREYMEFVCVLLCP